MNITFRSQHHQKHARPSTISISTPSKARTPIKNTKNNLDDDNPPSEPTPKTGSRPLLIAAFDASFNLAAYAAKPAHYEAATGPTAIAASTKILLRSRRQPIPHLHHNQSTHQRPTHPHAPRPRRKLFHERSTYENISSSDLPHRHCCCLPKSCCRRPPPKYLQNQYPPTRQPAGSRFASIPPKKVHARIESIIHS